MRVGSQAGIYLYSFVFCLLIGSFLVNHALAQEKLGTISVYVFKDGTPLSDIELSINNGPGFYTDTDGYALVQEAAGTHQLQVYIEDADQNLAFYKTSLEVVEGFDSQVIIQLNSEQELESLNVSEPVGQSPADSDDSLEAGDRQVVAGTGTLLGRVVSAENNQVITDARVYVRGSREESVTDSDGQFLLALPIGQPITLSIVHANFSAETLEDLVINDGETLELTIRMNPSGVEMEEFIVLAPNLEGKVESITEEKRDASSVTEILGSEQFSKQGDSDAASALRRATGLTLLGGRFVYVRGLGDRYSTSELNGLLLPSPDPTKRVVPLDMFPTSVVGSIKVQKGWSADLPANFGGGSIDIRTREAPDSFFGNSSFSLKYSDGSTFGEIKGSGARGGDSYGYDSVRDLTPYTKNLFDVVQNVSPFDTRVHADLLKNPLGVRDITALPGVKFSGALGNSYDRNPWNAERRRRLSWYGAYSYSQDNSIRQLQTRKATFREGGELATLSVALPSEVNEQNYEHGGLLGATYEHGLKHKYSLNNFYINLADSAVVVANDRDDGELVEYRTTWFERSLLISQLLGEHQLDRIENLTLNWSLQRGSAGANEPLTPFLGFVRQDGEQEFDLVQNKVNFQNNELDDNLFQIDLGAEYRFQIFNENFSSLSAGLAIVRKDRDAQSRRFGLSFEGNPTFAETDLDDAIDTLDVDDVSKVNKSSGDNETYTASHDIDAAFLKLNLFPTLDLELEVGARLENSIQQVRSAATGR